MHEVKKLARQTVIYGVGTMIPRFLNYVVLTPLYTYSLSNQADYGVIVELYAWMVLLLVILTYGMETGFFRFSKDAPDQQTVYGTALISLFISSGIFLLFVFLFIDDAAAFFNYRNNQDYIKMFATIVAVDAFCAIPFARLRWENRPVLFSFIKIANVTITVLCVVFLIKIAPALYLKGNKFIVSFYRPDYLVGYVFLSNLIGSVSTLLMLGPVIFKMRPQFSLKIWKRMFAYSFPLLIGGLAGTINDVIDKILVRRLTVGEDGLAVVGKYGAGYKIAVLMSLFVQMFRFAAEPFFFEKAGKKDARGTYAFVMKHFVVAAFIVFLVINLYIPIIQYMIPGGYRESLPVVPVISFAYLLYGVFLNLSVWYKINDKTWYGALFTICGALFTLAINWTLIPYYGYYASAWAHVVCYSVMVFMAFITGRKQYRIEYDIKGFFVYGIVAFIMVVINNNTLINRPALKILVNSFLLAGFILFTERRDRTLTLFLRKNYNEDE